MKRLLLLIAIIIGTLLLIVPGAYGWLWKMDKQIRPPLVAGKFYPDDTFRLRTMIGGLMNEVRPQFFDGAPLVIIVPHANPEYSGHVAAPAFSLIKGRKYKRVVVIGPSHVVAFPFVSIYDGDAYATPLGEVPVDKDFARKLAAKNPLFQLSAAGHEMYQGRGEHSIEIELPFLQEVLGDFKVVPIIMGEQHYTIERALGVALSQLIEIDANKNLSDTLIVVSTDLSHYHYYDQAVAMDRTVLDSIKENDFFSLSVNFENRIWEACGGGPVVSAMIAAERLGARDSEILKYATSGEITGDKSQVVGYGSATILLTDKQYVGKHAEFSIPEEDKTKLLALAKASIEKFVSRHSPPEIPTNVSDVLKTARGAFVTLEKEGHLRGCVGYITPSKPLAEAVRDVAVMAASQDSRFKPVAMTEIGQLKYEVSVLSPLHRITRLDEIQIGRDGLLLVKNGKQGILLPQVPVEFGWDVPEFIVQLAKKAGLPPNSWKEEDADLFAFSAVHFRDGE